jgi:hypothetical protein
LDLAAVEGNNFQSQERLGNLGREKASVLADLMDFDNDLLDECNVYDVGFRFACVLDEKLLHKNEGFLITILVFSLNSDLWTEKLLQILISKDLRPIKLERKNKRNETQN